MRGVDNTGRPFVLFVYKNIYNDELIYEFIYNNFTHHYIDGIPKNLWTYSGHTPYTYIGNLSYKKAHYDIIQICINTVRAEVVICVCGFTASLVWQGISCHSYLNITTRARLKKNWPAAGGKF